VLQGVWVRIPSWSRMNTLNKKTPSLLVRFFV
jgi:hypothetical protein